jgi:hypothetical protein
MIGFNSFFYHYSYSQSITRTHNQSSADPFFLDCRGLASFHSRSRLHGLARCTQIYVTIEGHSASLSWNKAPIWGLRPDLYYCLTDAGLLMCGALSGERTGLSFARVTASSSKSVFSVVTCRLKAWILEPALFTSQRSS